MMDGTGSARREDVGASMPPPPPRVPRLGVPLPQTSAPWGPRVPTPRPGATRRDSGTNATTTTTAIRSSTEFDFEKGVEVGHEEHAVPCKRISSEADVRKFLGSATCGDYVSFVKCLCGKLAGAKVTEVEAEGGLSEPLAKVREALAAVSAIVDEVPPREHNMRYGNPAFRDWHDLLCQRAEGLVSAVLPESQRGASRELAYYFSDSFGNRTRIDYGTGHETNFFVFLFCLAKLGLVQEGDSKALVLCVFNDYLKLMRRIQRTYGLEPAGSRGCWGLDDYQMLPFLFGAAQLVGHPLIKPKSVHNPDFVEAFAKDFLYFGCVEYVLQVKKGSLGETSPMLNDISAVGRWQKVSTGMLKMYEGEVLSKLPIVQHLGFGSLFRWEE